MKVLHVIPSVGPLRGGPSYVIQTLTSGLAARGCEVDVATTNDNGPELLDVPFGTPVPKDGVTFWYFPRQTRFYVSSWPLARWLKSHVADYDLVHIHTLFSFSVIPAAYWAHYRRVPYVVRPLGTLNRWGIQNRRPWLKQASLRLVESRILAGAAAVHFTSRQEREEAAEVAALERAVVIPNPIESPRKSRGNSPSGPHRKLRILFLSRLDRIKGLDLLLPAFAKLRSQSDQIELVLGGTGEEAFLRGLRETARNLGIESSVVWTGFLDGERKREALADADIFVLPSYSENFGIAVVEAMAAGLPVVVCEGVAIHREIAAAGAGLSVPCHTERLAEALGRLLQDPCLRSEMARNGPRLAEEFSPAVVSRQLLDLYESITQPRCIALT